MEKKILQSLDIWSWYCSKIYLHCVYLFLFTQTKYLLCYETILEYLKAFDDYASKKSYQNVAEIGKAKQETKKKKKEDAASAIYGNQDIVKEFKKEVEEKEKGKDEASLGASNIPSGASNMSPTVKAPASNMPSKSERGARASSKTTPSSKRNSAPIKTKPLVLSSTKPKLTGKARPKSTIDGKSPRPSGAEGGSAAKKSVKKEQLYQNVVFDESNTQF